MDLKRILSGIASRYGNKTTVMLAALVVLAAASVWIQWNTKPAPTPIENINTGPDYYLKNFTVTATDTDGSPRHRIKASYMEYISGQEIVTFVKPQLLFHNENRSSWSITGEQAQVTEQGKHIIMAGKVIMKQHTESGNETLYIETADLLVLPEQRVAKSEAKVAVKTDNSNITATGLRLDLNRDHLEFLHQTRGRYYAPPS